MRLIITLLLGCLLWQPALAAPVPTENQLKQELKQAESSKKRAKSGGDHRGAAKRPSTG